MPKISGKYIFHILLSILFISCPKPTEPDYTSKIEFKILDASCTEVWIKVKRIDLSLSEWIQIRREDSTVFNFKLESEDTIVLDTGLEPGRVYRYSLFYSGNFISSQEIRTLDTTSHEFEWHIFEFGDGCGSSSFYDVTIVNDTLIYAVGEVYIRDSTGECDPEFYNLAVWNGKKWELKKLRYKGIIAQIRSVFAISPDNVWFDEIFRWDGSRFIEMPIDPIFYGYGVNKIWGNSGSNVYAVSINGFIAHFDGTRWRRIESGTDMPIQDIWGDFNLRSGEKEILCLASTVYFGGESKILKIKKDSVEYLKTNGLPWSLKGIWFKSGRIYYVVGDGIYMTKLFDRWERILDYVNVYTGRVRGYDLNDIFIAGAFGFISHFNGYSWRIYDFPWMDSDYYGLDVKGNLVCAVGQIGQRALILIGKRKTNF